MLHGNELFAVHPVMLVMPWIPVIQGRKHTVLFHASLLIEWNTLKIVPLQ